LICKSFNGTLNQVEPTPERHNRAHSNGAEPR
jgi:hypothetical protein